MNTNRRQLLSLAGGVAFGWALKRSSLWTKGESPLLEKEICRLADLTTNIPIVFSYFHDSLGDNFIVRLGVFAQGGILPSRDLVAFNAMSIPVPTQLSRGPYLVTTRQNQHNIYGLSDSGRVISGPATVPLPQLAIEVRGQSVYALGFLSSDLGTSAT